MFYKYFTFCVNLKKFFLIENLYDKLFLDWMWKEALKKILPQLPTHVVEIKN